MIFLITGCDCSGKTSVFEELKKKEFFKDYIFFNQVFSKGQNDSYKAQAGKHIRSLYFQDKDVIGYRVPYIEDIIYSKLLEGKESPFKNSKSLNQLNDYYIFYLYADDKDIKERLKERGDDLVKFKDIHNIKKAYTKLLKRFKHVVPVNTSKFNTIEKATNYIIQKIKLFSFKRKVAHITTFTRLDCIENKDFYMSLAHLIKNPVYKQFYINRSKDSYVLMDNGECEGERQNINKLVRLYNEVRPQEVVLPDCINNGIKNIYLTVKGLRTFNKKLYYKPNYMIVPHGRNKSSYLLNLKILLKLIGKKIDVIGIGKKTVSRLKLVDEVKNILNDYKLYNIRIHLLGSSETLEESHEIFDKEPIVRSFDSCLATVYTFERRCIGYKSIRNTKVKMEFDRYCDEELLKENIRIIDEEVK